MEMRALDVVELRAASGRWPASTVGTILEVLDSAALIEIADEHGHAVDFLTLPLDTLRAVATSPQETLGGRRRAAAEAARGMLGRDPARSFTDELIAERRAEARAEDREDEASRRRDRG